jgi:AraC family transcriptional regulator, transcriptional activator of pobA
VAKAISIEDFYERKFNWVPNDLKREIGHFNVFRFEDFTGKNARAIPFNRRDYYKISLLLGKINIHYAHKTIRIAKQAILFSNPQIPYNWDREQEEQQGYFCVFTPAFFRHFGTFTDYSVFQPKGNPIFELTDEATVMISGIYERMLEELKSDYIHKYDALRNLVFEILHITGKMEPSAGIPHYEKNAASRISVLFLELLERQFPIEDPRQQLSLRSAADYADHLSIHINHLNKALKETSGKTTSNIIAERIVQEAKILLRCTDWNISEIAYGLGFNEPTHFNNFFRKHLDTSPTKFRND